MDSKDSDQTGKMSRLISLCSVHTHFVGAQLYVCSVCMGSHVPIDVP